MESDNQHQSDVQLIVSLIGSLLLFGSALLYSCSDKDDNGGSSYRHSLLTVKAIESDFENVKDNLFLYFFNKERKLEKVVKCEFEKEVDIELPYNNSYTVVALGYSADMQEPTVPAGTLLEDAQIVLSTGTFANNTVATSPGDIFYGRFELTDDCADVKEVIWVKRKVAALTVITRNLQAVLNTQDEDFSYLVRQTYGTLDFSSKLKGSKVAYHPTSKFHATNRDLVAPMSFTYPSQGDDGFSIDIYKGNTLIKSYATDQDENQLLLKEGKHTVVLIDYTDASHDGILNVSLLLKDWNDDSINEGFE